MERAYRLLSCLLAVIAIAGCDGQASSGGAEPEPLAAETGSPAADGAAAVRDTSDGAGDPRNGRSLDRRIAAGAAIFFENCASCHQGEGQGMESEVPPLAASDFLNEDKSRAIDVVANGLDGEVVVNGHEFAERMPSLGLSNEAIADVLTYVFSQWSNSGQVVLPDEVEALRR